MDKRGKKRLLILCAAVVVLLCTLSGCWQPATRGELIDWFQEHYTDAPLVVSSEAAGEDGGGTVSYEAYLEDAPDFIFSPSASMWGSTPSTEMPPILTKSMALTTLRSIRHSTPFNIGGRARNMPSTTSRWWRPIQGPSPLPSSTASCRC